MNFSFKRFDLEPYRRSARATHVRKMRVEAVFEAVVTLVFSAMVFELVFLWVMQ